MRVLLLQIASLFILLPASYCVDIKSNDEKVLLDIQTNLDPQNAYLSSWIASSSCSSWSGVVCDDSGYVTSLDLSKFTLSGSIPNSISNLTRLTTLLISNSNFNLQSISTSICKIKKLQTFEASSSNFSGSIPPCLANLTLLKSLDLSGNTLNGSLAYLPKNSPLVYLDLSGFNYSGNVNSISYLGDITTLKTIKFGRVQFTGGLPESFCQLKDLSILDFNGASISSFPSCFSSLAQITYIDFSQNHLASFPPFNSKWTLLKYLDLKSNMIPGTIPDDMSNLINLEHLDLSGNILRGIIPSFIGKFSRLSFLNLEGNRIVGNIPSEIADLTNLESLQLTNNILNGSIPEEIANLKHLNKLCLDSNNLTGVIPPSIGSLTNLTTLKLAYNLLDGDVPSEITNLKALTDLYLQGNNLSSLPSKLDSLSSLINLDLSYNSFQGNIPVEIANISSLNSIKLQFNQFSGGIPDFSKLQFLTELYLSKNQLSGSIPSSLFSVSSLTYLYLNDNQLTGRIPDVSGLLSLQYMFLDNNNLSGTLPSSFSSDNPIAVFSADNNQLTGRVSSSLANGFSQALSLANNRLSGIIPNVFYTEGSTSYINLQNNDLEGELDQFSALPKLKYLYVSNNVFSTSLEKFNLTNLSNLVQLSAASNKISGNLPSFKNNLNLLKLDFSYNNLTGSLPAIDDSLQYIDLSSNSFTGSINFDVLSFANGSFVSLQNNSLSGAASTTLYDAADVDIFLSGNPSCLNDDSVTCTAQPTFTNSWNYQPFCTQLDCNGETSPNPSLFNASGECFCSGYLKLIIELLSPPFSRFEDITVTEFQRAFFYGANSIADSTTIFDYRAQIQVVSVKQTSQVHTLEVRLYSSDGGPLPHGNAWTVINSMFDQYRTTSDPPMFLGDYFGPSNLVSYNFVYRSSFTGEGDTPNDRPRKKAFTSTPIFIAVMVLIALIAACIVLAIFLRRKKKDSGDVTIKVNQQLIPFIAFKVIEESTNHFSESSKIGTCGSAFIYRGKTREGSLLAVKRNFDLNAQTAKDFKNEVETLSKLRNSNLLRLIGYCNEFNEQISVFEFVPNGTLWDILHSDNTYPIRLGFKQRLKIALGSVEGLSYLISSPRYHQIKHIVDSHNILIDNNLQAIVSVIEFKPKSLNSGEGSAFKEDKMSLVYIDPQFINSGRLTTESVVYSFGIVLLELITGKKPLLEDEDITIVEWANELANQNKLSQIVDSRLGVNYSMDSVKRMVEIAFSCVEKIPSNRPSLQEILRALNDIDAPDDGHNAPATKMNASLLSASTRSDESV